MMYACTYAYSQTLNAYICLRLSEFYTIYYTDAVKMHTFFAFLILSLCFLNSHGRLPDDVEPRRYTAVDGKHVMRFSSNSHLKLLEVESGSFLVGTKNALYNISLSDTTGKNLLQKNRKIKKPLQALQKNRKIKKPLQVLKKIGKYKNFPMFKKN